jgi:hypothetical protein
MISNAEGVENSAEQSVLKSCIELFNSTFESSLYEPLYELVIKSCDNPMFIKWFKECSQKECSQKYY